MTTRRDYDLVLLGATGFAGRLTAEYLARTVPSHLRWAVAGRSRDRLDALVAHLGLDVAVLTCDVDDAGSVRSLAEQTRLLVTTVGPYMRFGDPVVEACARAGTDYLDLTGEPEFVDRTFVRHHRTALDSGARLVHAAGLDSIPHDLGAYFTVCQLPEGRPVHIDAYVRASMRISGGTLASALGAFGRPWHNLLAARARRAASHRPPGRWVSARAGAPGRDPLSAGWVLPLPTLDPQVVRRSAEALERYGPSFTYRHHASVPRLSTALGGTVALAGVVGAAQVPPLRRRLEQRIAAGEGPDEKVRAASWFSVTFRGRTPEHEVLTRIRGGDPGYGETAKMLGESALCLLLDDLPPACGQVTTAQAMGDALIDRLGRAGLPFEVIDADTAYDIRRDDAGAGRSAAARTRADRVG